MGKALRFDPWYLSAHEGFTVEETSASRYRPFRPPDITEHLIHLIWRNRFYNGGNMRTTSGLPVRVIDPGRHNRFSGPDFRNAVIVAGDEQISGDVEIHRDASEWNSHNHQRSADFNATVLHVFLTRKENSPPARLKNGRKPHELELGLYLRHPLERIHEELESAQSPVTGRRGAPPCRPHLDRLGPEGIARLLDLVADGRIIIKSNRIMDRVEKAGKEQAFFELLSESMGYSRFNLQFGQMARSVELKTLESIITKNPGLPPSLCLQAALFRLGGFSIPPSGPGAEEYFSRIEQVDLGQIRPIFREKDWSLSGCRPANFPQRRIAALSILMEKATSLSSLRNRLGVLDPGTDTEGIRSHARRLLDSFMGISDPFWDRHYSFAKQTPHAVKLVGKDKAVSIMVDCVIPFFCAISRTENDPGLEGRLALLFRALPLPASNAVTDYMKRNLFGKETGSVIRSVPRQQALLQIYKDHCHRSPAGCSGCSFISCIEMAKNLNPEG